jgi:Calcineurin-like phosphoesterase/Purple acid Phosphatase, N-terminal domain
MTMQKLYKFVAAVAILLTGGLLPLAAQHPHSHAKRAYHEPEFTQDWDKPGLHPDHLVLNPTADPASGMSVTWRTGATAKKGYAEIALATGSPKFWRNAITLDAKTDTLDASQVDDAQVVAHYHSVTFRNLLPDTMYVYRVGDGRIWSEWNHFRTASKQPKPFSFLYVGDAQNYILELWSRLIREAYRKAPNAAFVIHAGDLVNNAHNEQQWHEWFEAGGWIHQMLPGIPTPGNHEYSGRTKAEQEASQRTLSVQWKPQFTLPENGLPGLEETVYYLDYQGTRIISLNSNVRTADQVAWVEKVLQENPNRWTVITYHHPLHSASVGRDNKTLRSQWQPIFDRYGVDLVLQGHDHSYARGRADIPEQNIVAGLNLRDYTGTVYVVSVSGGKMYRLRPNAWEDFPNVVRDRGAENTQLFQVISINGDKLSFEAYTATGALYDAFDIVKEKSKPNRFVERKVEAGPEYRHDNTVPYFDEMPADLEAKVLGLYPGFKVVGVTYYDEPDFNGYTARLEQNKTRLDLRLDTQGTILKEERTEMK